MASVRDIRRKIRVVKNISQITQAMKMVAAAKLRRVQERVERGRPYSLTIKDLVGTMAPNLSEFKDPLLDVRPVGAVGIVVIAADKGLCGSYNSNILRLAHAFVDRKAREIDIAYGNARPPIRIITVGKKATDYFTKRGYNVVQSFPSIGVDTPYDQVRAASNAITGMFTTEQVDEVYVCYTKFVNTITQRPTSEMFLPIKPEATEETAGETEGRSEFIFEPDAPSLLAILLPRYVETRVYQLLMEAVASEFGAKMTAMTNATKNANDQIDALTLLANRSRQAGITKELLEIVGGAEALKG